MKTTFLTIGIAIISVTSVLATGFSERKLDRAIPRADALEVEIFKGDKETDKIPACVSKTGKTPRVIITDAKCENVIASYEGVPNRETLKAVEEKVTAARNLMKAAVEEKK